MKNLKNYLLITFFLTMLAGLFSINAVACCTCCFGPKLDDCIEVEGDCATICPDCSHCTNSLMATFNPYTDYILVVKGQPTYLVQGKNKIRLATDNQAAFFKTINARYAKSNMGDPKIKKEFEEAWASFLKKPDYSNVSEARMNVFLKETGLGFALKEKRNDKKN
jgi:hypothetical protein